MLEEQEQVVTGEVVENTDYIEAIKTLKQNSVDRSKYDALKAENKKLLDSIVNGTEVALPKTVEEPSIDDLRKNVFNNPDQTNLEYITNVLKLRDALMESGQEDPFVANSSQYTPDANDYARANKVATVLQEMVDVADGDPNVFLNEYQRRVKEVNIPHKNVKKQENFKKWQFKVLLP